MHVTTQGCHANWSGKSLGRRQTVHAKRPYLYGERAGSEPGWNLCALTLEAILMQRRATHRNPNLVAVDSDVV